MIRPIKLRAKPLMEIGQQVIYASMEWSRLK